MSFGIRRKSSIEERVVKALSDIEARYIQSLKGLEVTGPTGFSGAIGTGTTPAVGDYVKRQGDILLGRLGFSEDTADIRNGVINLSAESGVGVPFVIVNPDGNNQLHTIIPGENVFDNTMTFLCIQNQNVTFTTRGNIQTINGDDFTVPPNTVLQMMYVKKLSKWVILSSSAGVSTLGSVRTGFLESGLSSAHGITTDGTYFYIISLADAHVYRFNFDGTGRTDLFDTSLATPTGITTDGTHLYVADSTTIRVWRYNLDGTGATNLFRTAFSNIRGITTDGTYIYTVFSHGTESNTADRHVYRNNLDGTGETALIDTDESPQGITTDGTYIYTVDGIDKHVYRWNIDGSNKVDLFDSGLVTPTGMTHDDTYLYIVDNSNRHVFRYLVPI